MVSSLGILRRYYLTAHPCRRFRDTDFETDRETA
jgi:hypothetical protein